MITLTVNGQTYRGWLEVEVHRALDQLVHTFELRALDSWAEDDKPRPIRLGDRCVVAQDGETLITGWVDDLLYEHTGSDVVLRVSGRSLTGDLTDCSAIHKTGQWKNSRPIKIIRDIVEPFGILVVQDADLANDTTVVGRFDLEDGESAFDAIDRIARLRAWLPITTPEGWLRLTRVSRGRAKVKELRADNTIRRSVSQSLADRFSEYRLKSQTARADDRTSKRAALEKVSVTDPAVTRYRPLVVHATHGALVEELTQHAIWVRNTRAAQSERVTYTMPGTLATDGEIWEPGQLVAVHDQQIGIDDLLVLASTMIRESASSSTTELQLARIESYTAEPLPAKDLIKKLRKV